MHDYCTPDPCSDTNFSADKTKLLISLHPTMVSKRTIGKHDRPPRFNDSIKMSFFDEGPNASTARMRDPRYEHKAKKDSFALRCANKQVEKYAPSGSGKGKKLLGAKGKTLTQKGDFPTGPNTSLPSTKTNPSPTIPGPFPEFYDCSKKYKYTGNHPDFKGKEIYNGQFPNELLALASHGRGGGAGQQNNRTIVAREAVESYDKMAKAFKEQTGKHLVGSGYRPIYRQQKSRQSALRKYGSKKGSKAYSKSATPGFSTHGLGLAVDFKNDTIDNSTHGWTSPTYLWLVENANSFGWHHPDWASAENASEPWHWEFKNEKNILVNAEGKSEGKSRRRKFEKDNKIDCSKKNPKLKVFNMDGVETRHTLYDTHPLLKAPVDTGVV